MEGIAHLLHHLTFLFREVEFTFNLSVDALTSLTTKRDDGSISIWHFLHERIFAEVNFWIFLLSHLWRLEPLSWVAVGLEFQFGKIHILLINLC